MRLTHDSKNPLVIGKGGPGEMTEEQKRNLGICSCVGTIFEYSISRGEVEKLFVANLSLNTDKTAYATLQHLYNSLSQSPMKEIIENQKFTKLEVTHDNAPCYISKEFLYGVTKGLFRKYPHLRILRWVPLAPCHGKTDLDRRFSNFTTWINSFELNKRIGSIEQMKIVLTDGITGSNIRRQERGEMPIPTSVNLFKLATPPATADYLEIDDIKSMHCVTYVSDVDDHLDASHSGFYNSVFPWIHWKNGKPLLPHKVFDGPRGRVLNAKQLRLRPELKRVNNLEQIYDIKTLMTKHNKRRKLLTKLGMNLKEALEPQF